MKKMIVMLLIVIGVMVLMAPVNVSAQTPTAQTLTERMKPIAREIYALQKETEKLKIENKSLKVEEQGLIAQLEALKQSNANASASDLNLRNSIKKITEATIDLAVKIKIYNYKMANLRVMWWNAKKKLFNMCQESLADPKTVDEAFKLGCGNVLDPTPLDPTPTEQN